MDTAVNFAPHLVRMKRFRISSYGDLRALFSGIGRFKLGRYTVNRVGAEFEEHFGNGIAMSMPEAVEVDDWFAREHVTINEFRDMVGMMVSLGIEHIFGSFVELHHENADAKRLDFLSFATSPKTGELMGIDIERFDRTVEINAFGASQDFTIHKGVHIVVPA